MKKYMTFIILFAGLMAGCGSDSGREKSEGDTMIDIGAAMSGFAEVNGAKIYYEQAGEGTPLVMLHAGIADCRMWQKQLEYFSQHYKVITYDLRGFGKTGMPEGPYAHYRDLAGLLDTLGIDSAIVMGCSLGGSVAIDFALEYPGRILGLALVGSSVDGYRMEDEKTIENWRRIDKAIRKRDFDKAADLEVEQWVVGAGRSPERFDRDIITLARDMILTHYRNNPDKGQEEGPDELSVNRLAEISVPALVVVGELDSPDMMNIADLLKRALADSKKIMIPETAHLPNLEKPDAFNALVHGFLRDKGL
jgi:pimeloyl-ACP methyl ester carboxylesterase